MLNTSPEVMNQAIAMINKGILDKEIDEECAVAACFILMLAVQDVIMLTHRTDQLVSQHTELSKLHSDVKQGQLAGIQSNMDTLTDTLSNAVQVWTRVSQKSNQSVTVAWLTALLFIAIGVIAGLVIALLVH